MRDMGLVVVELVFGREGQHLEKLDVSEGQKNSKPIVNMV